MKPPVKTSFRGRDVAYLVISIVLVGVGYAAYRGLYFVGALLHKDLKCKAPLMEPNLRRNLGKWST